MATINSDFFPAENAATKIGARVRSGAAISNASHERFAPGFRPEIFARLAEGKPGAESLRRLPGRNGGSRRATTADERRAGRARNAAARGTAARRPATAAVQRRRPPAGSPARDRARAAASREAAARAEDRAVIRRAPRGEPRARAAAGSASAPAQSRTSCRSQMPPPASPGRSSQADAPMPLFGTSKLFLERPERHRVRITSLDPADPALPDRRRTDFVRSRAGRAQRLFAREGRVLQRRDGAGRTDQRQLLQRRPRPRHRRAARADESSRLPARVAQTLRRALRPPHVVSGISAAAKSRS